jgi:hypothetical protein
VKRQSVAAGEEISSRLKSLIELATLLAASARTMNLYRYSRRDREVLQVAE